MGKFRRDLSPSTAVQQRARNGWVLRRCGHELLHPNHDVRIDVPGCEWAEKGCLRGALLDEDELGAVRTLHGFKSMRWE